VTSYSDRDAERSDLRQAYEMGRRDAKRARRRHPVLMTFLIVAAAVGLIVMALAAVNGSFGSAGTVVDQNLATAADEAVPAAQNAAANAGQAVKSAADGKAGDDTVPH
jgi:cytochrome bd-type quinol oxidase subunit 1